MKVQEDDRRFRSPKFLKVMIERRNKRRAPSFDATIESSSSSLDVSHRNTSPSNSQHKAVTVMAAPIVIEEEEGDNGVLSVNLKKDIALANRVAALKAQQLMLGENHPDVLFSLQNLAALHYRRGHYDEAQQVLADQQARSERAQYEQASLTIPQEIAFCHRS